MPEGQNYKKTIENSESITNNKSFTMANKTSQNTKNE